jgi:hypothetical protein
MRIKENKLLREWIRISLTDGLLTEDRGTDYEGTIVAGMKNIPDVELGPPAGNNNAISDLGITFRGIDIAAEVKLNDKANLGAVSKDSIEKNSMEFVGGKVVYAVKAEPEHQANKEVIDAAIENLNSGGVEGLQDLLDALTTDQPAPLVDKLPLQGTAWSSQVKEAALEFSEKYKADPQGMPSWITADMKRDIVFRVLRDEANKGGANAYKKLENEKKGNNDPKKIAELTKRIVNLTLNAEHVAAGFKTLSEVLPNLGKTVLNSPVLSADQLRTIMTRKKGPNGADTDYLITGNDDENSVSGEIHHIGKDVLGLGTPLFNPSTVYLEVRFQGGGSGGKGNGNYSLTLRTKANKGPAGLKFNNAEDLAAIFANSRVAQSQDGDSLKSKLKSQLFSKSNPQPSGRRAQKPTMNSQEDQGRIDRETRRDPYANLSASLKRAVFKRLLQEAQKN